MWGSSLGTRVLAVLVCAAVTCVASAATATGVGPRLGMTSAPDQMHMGLQACATLSPQFHFAPGFDVGFGNEPVLLSGNFDFKLFARTHSRWSPYLGGGPAVHFVRRDDGEWQDAELGAAVIGGMQTRTHSGAFFAEMRLGFVDSPGPDYKASVGWLFW